MSARTFLFAAAGSGFTAVALGAFGAHGLRTVLSPYLLDVFQTAVQYQFYHTLALLAVALLAGRGQSRRLQVAGSCFLAGILLFCGSLYLLALSGVHWLGAVTPLGGLAFLGGWTALAAEAYCMSRNPINAD